MKSDQILRSLRKHPLLVACSFLSIGFIGAIVYRNGTLGSLDQAVQERQDRMTQIQRNNRNAISLTEDLARLDQYNKAIEAGLVEVRSKAANLAYLYELGADCSLEVKRADQTLVALPSEPVKGSIVFDNYRPVRFNLGVEGSFAAVVRFLNRLPKERFLARVNRVNMVPGEALLGRVVGADIMITALALNPEQEEGHK